MDGLKHFFDTFFDLPLIGDTLIQLLNEGLLNSEYTLAEARVLYELATRTSPKAGEIAEER